MKVLYPKIEPFRTGRLKVSDLHEIFYEEVGNPAGKPAVFLHGGPGAGIIPDYRRFFDSKVYRLILPDQRGAGRSTPHADLRENTTDELVDDLEKLRRHLGIDRWVVLGGSWGSMLALCYAIKYPESVKGIIIRGVCLGRQSETDWLFQFGMSWVYPDEWELFRAAVPKSERGDMVAAYHRLLTTGTDAEQIRAAKAWSRWESSTMNLVPDPDAIADFTDEHKALAMARIECHFTLKKWFLESDNYILEHAQAMAKIPIRIVQGRYDVICPVISAWDLHKALPHSDLRIIALGSHSPLDAAMVDQLVQATEDFKTL